VILAGMGEGAKVMAAKLEHILEKAQNADPTAVHP